jgi:hypothetical protein
MIQPLLTIKFDESSGLQGAFAYISPDAELTQLHVNAIIQARQMTIEWACTEDKEYMKGWDPSKYF